MTEFLHNLFDQFHYLGLAQLSWGSSAIMSTGLETICTPSYVAGLVSAFTSLPTVEYFTDNVTAAIVTNYTGASYGTMLAVSDQTFCNVTLSLKHTNLDDLILHQFWLPEPSAFENRYLTNGGSGWSVSSSWSLSSGLPYGAVSGTTDGGFGGFGSTLTADLLQAGGNGTMAWSRFESFSYQAVHEMTVTGKELTKAFYGITDDELHAYYLGCSEGGREGHMFTQRFPDDFHGVVAGAPAMYWPVMQLAQGWPNIAMAQLNHWPSPCAFDAIMEDYITACDPLDGLTDGIISRSELCTYNATSSVGKTWSNCTSGGDGAPTSGTISELDAAVVNLIYRGPLDSNGNQIFFAYQPGTSLTVEAAVEWDNATQSFGAGVSSYFDPYYQNMVLRTTVTPTVSYSNITVEDIYQLMIQGLQEYGAWAETTWPDLTNFQAAGGKFIHYHGEQDTNLFPQASAHFYEKVHNAMFPGNDSYEELQSFYRFFRVPGAGHCVLNTAQPDGPYPQYVLQQMIDWVESGVAPAYLNGTRQDGLNTQTEICMWPSAPLWKDNGTTFVCEDVDPSTFIKPLNAWKDESLL